MTISDTSGLVRDDATVEIPVREFARLVMTADKYRTIVKLALKDAELVWDNRLRLNIEDVCKYIEFVEPERLDEVRRSLIAEKERQEAEK